MPTPADNPPPDYQSQAQELLARLVGSTRRDRIAFALGYAVAFNAMADALTPHDFIHHRHLAAAIHTMCSEDPQ